MNLANFFPREFVDAIGWTILHSLWQGAIVALLLGIVLLFLNKRSAKVRAMISYSALIILLAASFNTFTGIYGSSLTNHSVSEGNNAETASRFTGMESSVVAESTGNKVLTLLGTSINSISAFYENNLNLFVTLWFIGIFFLTFKLAGGLIYTQRVKHYRIFPVPECWNTTLQKISHKMNLNKCFLLFESALVNYPIVIGYFKPFILLPIGTLTGLPQNQIEAILAHELAHIKRADYLLNILQSIIEILFFFNPAVWWISSIISDEREYSCDDLAVEVCGSSITLAKALVNVKQNNVQTPAFALGAIGNKKSLLTRIKRMSNYNSEKLLYPKKLATVIFLIVSFAVITLIACSSQSEALNNENSSGVNFDNNGNKASIVNIPETQKIEDDVIEIPTPPNPAWPPRMPNIVLPSLPLGFSEDDSGKPKKYSFYDDESGEEVHWEVVMEDGKIVELYRDNDKIPDDEIVQYEDYIFKKLDEIRDGLNELKFNMHDLHFNMDKLSENLSNLKFDFDFDFDDETFAHLHEGLDELKDMNFQFDFYFDDAKWERDSTKHHEFWDDDEFEDSMKNLRKELSKMKLNKFHFDFDKEKFKGNMLRFKKDIKNFHLDMDKFKFDMKDLKENLKGLKDEMKIFKEFMKEVRSELVKDGYIEDEDEEFEFDLDENMMEVNDKKLPDDLHQKYLDMYQKHHGKKLENRVRIH